MEEVEVELELEVKVEVEEENMQQANEQDVKYEMQEITSDNEILNILLFLLYSLINKSNIF